MGEIIVASALYGNGCFMLRTKYYRAISNARKDNEECRFAISEYLDNGDQVNIANIENQDFLCAVIEVTQFLIELEEAAREIKENGNKREPNHRPPL